MLSPLAPLVLALSPLAPSCEANPGGRLNDLVATSPPPITHEFVIARPEASDLHIPRKARTDATALLERNPELIRHNLIEQPYRLKRATNFGWQVYIFH